MIGALLAVGVGWTSIIIAIRLPLDQWIQARDLRRAGATALAVLAFGVLGAPVPAWWSVVALGIGVAVGVGRQRLQRERRD